MLDVLDVQLQEVPDYGARVRTSVAARKTGCFAHWGAWDDRFRGVHVEFENDVANGVVMKQIAMGGQRFVGIKMYRVVFPKMSFFGVK